MNYLFVLFSHFFLFNPGSVLVRRGLVASKQSSLVANCVRLTFFSGVNVNNSSKYNLCLTACSVFDFNSGFLPIYQGWTLFMGKLLERWIFGIRHLQHPIPYLEWVTITSVSPEWVSTSDSLVWVTLTYPRGEYRQHHIGPRNTGRQHQNPRGGCRQQQIPRYGCPQNQIPWVGCRQHWISWGGCHQHWIPWVGCRQHWIPWVGCRQH